MRPVARSAAGDHGFRRHGRIDPRIAAVTLIWLVAAGSLAVMVLLGVQGTGRFGVARDALHVTYVAALLWYLTRRGPSIDHLPELPLGHAANGRVGRLVAAGATLVVCLAGLFDRGLFLELLAAAGVVTVVVWRKQVTTRAVVAGLAASAVAFATGGIAFWRHGFVAKPMLVFMLIFIPHMFVAGGLLVARTGLGAVRVLEGRYGVAGRSFLAGAVLFVPLGLANAAGPARPGPVWVSQWWQPLVLPVWSGIVEEVVFRTVLICLLLALLRPVLKRSSAIAIGFAILFSAVVFGLGHGQTLNNLLGAGLGYGLPLAVVFARRDWEHAVGAHYMINMVPWLTALLVR